MKLSLIILSFGQFSLTQRCLQSILDQSCDSDSIEIVLVDNSADEFHHQQALQFCNTHQIINYHSTGKNLGFAGGMNYGVQHSQGEWLLLVNNDTEFPALALNSFCHVIDKAPCNTGIIAPITNAAGNGQQLYLEGMEKESILRYAQTLHENPTGHFWQTYRSDFFCIAINQAAWKELNGLSLDYGKGYYEDFDFSLRLRASKWQQLITEDVFIWHQGSATFSAIRSEQKILMKANKKKLRARFTTVRFEHQRECNHDMLKQYREQLPRIDEMPASLQLRAKARLQGLTNNLPKSPLKRLLWRNKTKAVKQYFSAFID